jgi:hypothetical protein
MEKAMKKFIWILMASFTIFIYSCNDTKKTEKTDTDTTSTSHDTTKGPGVAGGGTPGPLVISGLPSFSINKTYLETLRTGGYTKLSISIAFIDINKPTSMRLIISAMHPTADPVIIPASEISVLSDPTGSMNNTVIVGNSVITIREMLEVLGQPRIYERLILVPGMCSEQNYPDNVVLKLKGIVTGEAPTAPGINLDESKPSPPAPPMFFKLSMDSTAQKSK